MMHILAVASHAIPNHASCTITIMECENAPANIKHY